MVRHAAWPLDFATLRDALRSRFVMLMQSFWPRVWSGLAPKLGASHQRRKFFASTFEASSTVAQLSSVTFEPNSFVKSSRCDSLPKLWNQS